MAFIFWTSTHCVCAASASRAPCHKAIVSSCCFPRPTLMIHLLPRTCMCRRAIKKGISAPPAATFQACVRHVHTTHLLLLQRHQLHPRVVDHFCILPLQSLNLHMLSQQPDRSISTALVRQHCAPAHSLPPTCDCRCSMWLCCAVLCCCSACNAVTVLSRSARRKSQRSVMSFAWHKLSMAARHARSQVSTAR